MYGDYRTRTSRLHWEHRSWTISILVSLLHGARNTMSLLRKYSIRLRGRNSDGLSIWLMRITYSKFYALFPLPFSVFDDIIFLKLKTCFWIFLSHFLRTDTILNYYLNKVVIPLDSLSLSISIAPQIYLIFSQTKSFLLVNCDLPLFIELYYCLCLDPYPTFIQWHKKRLKNIKITMVLSFGVLAWITCPSFRVDRSLHKLFECLFAHKWGWFILLKYLINNKVLHAKWPWFFPPLPISVFNPKLNYLPT